MGPLASVVAASGMCSRHHSAARSRDHGALREIDDRISRSSWAELGRRSIAYDGVTTRCRIIDGDLRVVRPELGAFELVTGTPPYFPRGTGTESAKPHATPCRFEVRGGVEEYLESAQRVLAPGGQIVVVTSARESDRVTSATYALGLHRREHWDIVPRAGKDVLVMVDVLTDAPTESSAHTLTVRDRASVWTPEFQLVRAAMGLPSKPA